MTLDELLNYLFDGEIRGQSSSLAQWAGASPRFAAFLETYRDKIRKKIRVTRDSGSFSDLLLELETAYSLLQERQFTLVYEPYGKGKMRGPDFAVTFKTRITFNVEVTHMRGPSRPSGSNSPALDVIFKSPNDDQPGSNRLTDIVCSKLGQMVPGMVNVLVVNADHRMLCELDVSKVMARLKERAERRDESLFNRHKFPGTAQFFKHYQQLSAILLRGGLDDGEDHCTTLWVNTQAKHPLPSRIRAILAKG